MGGKNSKVSGSNSLNSSNNNNSNTLKHNLQQDMKKLNLNSSVHFHTLPHEFNDPPNWLTIQSQEAQSYYGIILPDLPHVDVVKSYKEWFKKLYENQNFRDVQIRTLPPQTPLETIQKDNDPENFYPSCHKLALYLRIPSVQPLLFSSKQENSSQKSVDSTSSLEVIQICPKLYSKRVITLFLQFLYNDKFLSTVSSKDLEDLTTLSEEISFTCLSDFLKKRQNKNNSTEWVQPQSKNIGSHRKSTVTAPPPPQPSTRLDTLRQVLTLSPRGSNNSGLPLTSDQNKSFSFSISEGGDTLDSQKQEQFFTIDDEAEGYFKIGGEGFLTSLQKYRSISDQYFHKMEIIVENEQIFSDKLLLIQVPYFESLINLEMKEKLSNKVYFEDWTYECIFSAIEYLYSLDFPNDLTLMVEIIRLGDYYNYKELEDDAVCKLCELALQNPPSLVPLLNYYSEVNNELLVKYFNAAAADFYGVLNKLNALDDLPDQLKQSLRQSYSKLRRGIIVKRRGKKSSSLCPQGVVKIFVWGQTNVGKTSLCSRFSRAAFSNSPSKKPVSLRINDNFTCDVLEGRPNQPASGLLLDQFVNEMSNVSSYIQPQHKEHYEPFVQRNLLLFSISDPSSLEYLKIVRENLIRVYGKVAFTLVANKIDIMDRSVGVDEPRDLAISWDCPYIEVSSRDDVNVTDAFRLLARETPA